MARQKTLHIDNVLVVLKEVKGKQKDAAEKLKTSTATISRCLKEHGYVPVITYVKEERA